MKGKKLTVIRMCRRCNGNVFKEIPHDCEKSLFDRKMKFATNPPKNGNIVHMTKDELKNYKAPEPKVETDPKEVQTTEKFLSTCESVSKQLESVKNNKELEAIEERFSKAFDKFKKMKPTSTPDIAVAIVKEIEDLKEKFTSKK